MTHHTPEADENGFGIAFPPRNKWDVASYPMEDVVAGYLEHLPDEPAPGDNRSPGYRWGWANRRYDVSRKPDGFDAIRSDYIHHLKSVRPVGGVACAPAESASGEISAPIPPSSSAPPPQTTNARAAGAGSAFTNDADFVAFLQQHIALLASLSSAAEPDFFTKQAIPFNTNPLKGNSSCHGSADSPAPFLPAESGTNSSEASE